MKKTYTGLMAEKIDFGAFNSITTADSLPPGCIQIVANVVEPNGNTCGNPSSTTSYMYIGDNPGWD